MPKIDIDLMPTIGPKPAPGRLRKIIIAIAIVIIILLAVFSSSALFSGEGLIRNLAKLDILKQIGSLIRSGDKELAGESNDRINILIIGIGGKYHDGGTLADTIILGSLRPSDQRVAMMSIPRDLSVPDQNNQWEKINAVHAYAEAEKENSGGKVMTETLGRILNDQIPYYVVIDFDGFERLIDEFGGVDIEVERDLIDKSYPIRGKEDVYPIENRFETLHIKKGRQYMDGELALKYARSRHAEGLEGSDFARSRRQQKILTALKEKIFKVDTLLNPKKINSLLTAYNEHVNTNLEMWQLLRLAKLGENVDTSQIANQTLTDGPTGYLYSQIINGAYVLLPNGNNFDKIKELWQNIFGSQDNSFLANMTRNEQNAANDPETTNTTTANETKTENLPANAPADYKDEKATMEIQNGTRINGWAGQEKNKLVEQGFNVINIGNADNQEYDKILLYDLTNGKKPLSAQKLEKMYQTKIIDLIPQNINTEADFLLVLGKG